MLTPFISLTDPLVQAEGSLDPIGLASLADKISDIMLPGMTARMWRPRFLTAMAVAAIVTEPFEDWSPDGTPPYVVFEWYSVEAFARSNTENDDKLRRIPGIDKARTALHEKIPMSSQRYLKTPTVFGFNGVYKTLARALDIVDNELTIKENGYRLLRTWEREQKLEGFSDGNKGIGAALRKHLINMVKDGIKKGHTVHNSRWRFFPEYLRPNLSGSAERRLLWELIVNDSGGTRGEVFYLLQKSKVRANFRDRYGLDEEAKLLKRIKTQASRKLIVCLIAIESHEKLCRLLQDGFDWIRYVSSQQPGKSIKNADCSKKIDPLALKLPLALKNARAALFNLGHGTEVEIEQLISAFGDVRCSGDFFEALLRRHENVQKTKPPEGKRAWFERTQDGGVIIRPPYRLDNKPSDGNYYVHGYRMPSVASFVAELNGGR